MASHEATACSRAPAACAGQAPGSLGYEEATLTSPPGRPPVAPTEVRLPLGPIR